MERGGVCGDLSDAGYGRHHAGPRRAVGAVSQPHEAKQLRVANRPQDCGGGIRGWSCRGYAACGAGGGSGG